MYKRQCQEDDGTDSVYIGEAENVLDRLTQHLRDYQSGKEKYYWNTAVIFVGRDLNKALIRYLENRFVEIAKDCGRYSVLTKNTYKNTVLKEAQIASMEEFIDNVKILINTLGYKVLVPVPKATDETIYLYCKGSGASAKGFISTGGFTVLAGSKVSDHRFCEGYLKSKIEQGTVTRVLNRLKDIDEYNPYPNFHVDFVKGQRLSLIHI